MASVFLSYDRDDAAKARAIAGALEKAGHSVWWDRHIKSGAQYNDAIEEALKQAHSVVVLWSAQSIQSAWVRDEAVAGRDSGRLVPVLIDGTAPPLGFRQYQNIDLSRWKGRGKPAQLAELIAAIGPVADAPAPIEAKAPSSPSFRIKLALIALAIAAVVLAALGIWQISRPRPIPTIAVMPADSSASTRAMTRDLTINLARLQAAKADSMRLVDTPQGSSAEADLIFETRASNDPGAMRASLALLAGKSRSILWSDDFGQEGTNRADLQQQLAVTAARVLGCALEGLPAEGRQLPQEVLGLYLSGCANLDETLTHDTSNVIPILERVTKMAPYFKPGWSKLLIAESEKFLALYFPEQAIMTPTLRQHIISARKLDPNLAEAFLVEIYLLPGDAFLERMRLVDRAATNDPANAYVLSARSDLLMDAGYMGAAVDDAERAADMEPLSPGLRSSHITTLGHAGRIDAAKERLADAERLWPGATTLIDARYRLSLRYGDPADALRLEESGATVGAASSPGSRAGRFRSAFLRARLKPTKENVDRAIALTWSTYRKTPETIGDLMQTLGEFGRADEIFPEMLSWKRTNQIPYFADVLFRPTLAGFRKDPRFIRVAARLGLLDFWRKRGIWPDFCLSPDLPYDCEKEAAKIAA